MCMIGARTELQPARGCRESLVPGDNFTFTSTWETSVRGRLGYAWGPTLFYATGGVSWTRVSVGTGFIAIGAFPASAATDTATLHGPTAGGGLEYAVSRHVSIGIEGRYSWYGSHTYNGGTVAAIGAFPAGTFVSTPVTQTLKLSTAEAVARVNWRF